MKKRLQILQDLYDYVKKSHDIDPTNIRVSIIPESEENSELITDCQWSYDSLPETNYVKSLKRLNTSSWSWY